MLQFLVNDHDFPLPRLTGNSSLFLPADADDYHFVSLANNNRFPTNFCLPALAGTPPKQARQIHAIVALTPLSQNLEQRKDLLGLHYVRIPACHSRPLGFSLSM